MIVPAQTGEHLEHLISLAHEYVTWMAGEIQQQYPELDLAEFTSEHAYDDLRKKFPGEHVCLLIAMHDSELCGCEVRTLYVRPACRGLGIGKQLVEAVLDQARTLGYGTARLDTLAFMHGAQQLYRSLGFYDIEPYLDLSDSLKQYIRFFEMKLIPPYDHRSAERLARFS
jgi:GNAT superfamily N-acetyltransferase